MIRNITYNIYIVGSLLIATFIFLAYPTSHLISAENPAYPTVGSSGYVRESVIHVAPGESIPISIRLSNFGGGKRVDVLVSYFIFTSSMDEVYASNETVAVETTADFIKNIPLPKNSTPGTYIAKTSITYAGQKIPATTQFTFTVERKIFGFFESDFFIYLGIIIVAGIAMFVLGHTFVTRRRKLRLTPFDYSDIPHDKRIFFEILSDTIMEMRNRVGDKALHIASSIPGLKVDAETGRVLDVTEHPSKIIAVLVSEYEKLLGKKVSFSFRAEKADL